MSSSGGGGRRNVGGEIVTVQCGATANWIGAQYHLLQNSNCDANSSFSRTAHFRRSEVGPSSSSTAGASSSAAVVGDADSSVWSPRVVCMDASVGLDGVVATFDTQRDGDAEAQQDDFLTMYTQKQQAREAAVAKAKAAANAPIDKRPKHWSDLAKNVMPFHRKSLYSVPGLFEGTSDFHLHEQGKEIMERETVHEDVIDRVRWFLEECDQPDGLHVIVDGNSGWSGVGSTLLGLLRDEYERIPIFCISSILPPSPPSALGQTFSSNTSTLHSVLNSSLLLQSASQLATAYLPLTTHYWATNAVGQAALPDAHAAIQRGEMYESSTMMAWIMHLATADYRIQPRTTNMATALAGLTQQGQANVLGAKLLTQLQLTEQQQQASASFNAATSSSMVAATSVIHTHPSSLPLSLLGHGHAFQPEPVDAGAYAHAHDSSSKPSECGVHTDLTESVHVFGNTEELSHRQLIAKMDQQPPALYRRVFGTTRMNLPPSFPLSYYDMLNDGHVLSTYRCSYLGRELFQWGTWLSQLNRGGVSSSHYTASSSESRVTRVPLVLAHLQSERQRAAASQLDEDGDRTRGGASEQLQMTHWTQQEIDEFMECGASLQNTSELY